MPHQHNIYKQIDTKQIDMVTAHSSLSDSVSISDPVVALLLARCPSDSSSADLFFPPANSAWVVYAV